MCSFQFGQSNNSKAIIDRKFVTAGRIEALIDASEHMDFLLVQLDLKNDSLFALVDDALPGLELFSGPASYHRIMTKFHLDQIQNALTDEFYSILDEIVIHF